MSRQQDVLDARRAADDWAVAHGTKSSGGYSADWFLYGYLNGWWPAGWLKWWADYTAPAGSILDDAVGVVMHQYTSRPIDQNIMLPSETGATQHTVAEYKQALSYLRHDVIGPLASYKYPRIRAAVAEMNRVAEQYGAE